PTPATSPAASTPSTAASTCEPSPRQGARVLLPRGTVARLVRAGAVRPGAHAHAVDGAGVEADLAARGGHLVHDLLPQVARHLDRVEVAEDVAALLDDAADQAGGRGLHGAGATRALRRPCERGDDGPRTAPRPRRRWR